MGIIPWIPALTGWFILTMSIHRKIFMRGPWPGIITDLGLGTDPEPMSPPDTPAQRPPFGLNISIVAILELHSVVSHPRSSLTEDHQKGRRVTYNQRLYIWTICMVAPITIWTSKSADWTLIMPRGRGSRPGKGKESSSLQIHSKDSGLERVTGRKARGLQMEEIACKCQTFLSLLSGRKKQTNNIFFLLYTNLKRGFS